MSTLSVILPNYNDSNLIGDALTAICEQSRPPDEVIVVDDGSTDNSVEIIEELARRYPVIKLLRNPTNMGVMYSGRRAFEAATCDLIYAASANDRALPGLFEQSLALLDQYPQAGLSCADIEIYNETTGESREVRRQWLEKPGYLTGSELADRIDGGNMLGLTWVTRRELMVKLNGYPTQLKWHSDWFLHHVIGFRYGTVYIPQPLAVNRIESESYSNRMFDPAQQRQVFIEFIKLLCTGDYNDVIPLMMRSRLLSVFDPVMSLSAIVEGITQADNWDPSVKLVLRQLLMEKAKVTTARPRRAISQFDKQVRCSVHEAVGLAKNSCDRAYARAFHEYVQVRQRLTGR